MLSNQPFLVNIYLFLLHKNQEINSDRINYHEAHLDEFTDSPEVIRKAVFEALCKIELKKKVRLIGLRLSILKKG